MIDLIYSIILGIIQGLTEFLPVSSSGHLVIAESFMKFHKPDMSFEIILHLGSLLAVIIYFRKDIIDLAKSLVFLKREESKQNHKIIIYLVIATFVTAIIGILFEDFIESLFSKPVFAAVFLSITGLIIFISDKISQSEFKISEIGIRKSLIIGLAQSFAILPGISRSGTTIATSVFLKIKREDAAKFSFLLSIPAILGAVVLKLDELSQLNSAQIINYSFGAIAAFVSGYLVISMLIKLVKKQKLRYFSYYCWSISLISIIALVVIK